MILLKTDLISPKIDITRSPPLPLHLALRRCERVFHALRGRGPGEPLVMVHGNPTWSFFFVSWIKGLSSRYRCIAPDHIGCGLSARPRSFGIRLPSPQPGDDLHAFIGTLGLEKKITLVLHDWGGMIGAAFAVCHPERIARLVVLNTAAFPKPSTNPCHGR